MFHGLGHVDIIQLVFDLAALTVAWRPTFEWRLILNPYMAIAMSEQQLRRAAPPLLWILCLWTATNLWLTVSGRSNRDGGRMNIFRLSEATLAVSTISIVVAFFSDEMGATVSRSFTLLFAAISYSVLITARVAQSWVCRQIARTWPAVAERVAVVGYGAEAVSAIDGVRASESPSTQLVGVIVPTGAAMHVAGMTAPVLGETRSLAELINRNRVDRLVVLKNSLDSTELERCNQVARRMGVVLSRELSRFPGVHLSLQARFGMDLLEFRPVSFTRAEELLRRGFDILASTALLALLLPLIVVTAILVKASSRGSILYRAPRVGRGGRYFTFYKFRTMYQSTEGRLSVAEANERSGHIFKIKHDPRITPLGRILRRFSVDEIPQLLNVLIGDMSLIGPRPLPAEDLDADGMSCKYPAWAELRSLVKPGITGLWQVRGRSDLPFHDMIRLDLEYVQSWSLMLDLKIIMATPLVVIAGRGAY
jgi:exopolysaccharide biosynthesis polyprenyl glycosylphosphotransferase